MVKALAPDMIERAAFTPDSRRVIAPGHTGELFVWSTADGSELRKIKLSDGPLVWAAVSPTGHLFAATDALGKAWLIDGVTYKVVKTLELEQAGNDDTSHLVAFTRDRRHVVTMSLSGKVRVFASGH